MPINLTFPKDSSDSIEKLFADKILVHFPYYGKFWEEFIGRRPDESPALRPYGLKLPETIGQDDLKRVKDAYEKLVVKHYSLFCELAGAHYQIGVARKSMQENVVEKKHFLFWESFGNFYQHAGNARNMLYGIWDEVQRIVRTNENLERYLEGLGRQDLFIQLEAIQREIVSIRNNLVHYMHSFYIPVSDGYLIPLPIEENPAPFTEPKEAIDAEMKMKSDLARFESLLNEIEPFFSNSLRNYFRKNAISVDK